MNKKYYYEILLTTNYVSEDSWLNFIFSVSKINGWLRRWKIYVEIQLNEVKYFVKSSRKLPPAIGTLGDFLLKPIEPKEKIKSHFSFPYYLSTKYPSILDVFDRNESRFARKLELTEITFLSYKRDNFLSFTKLFFRTNKDKLKRKSGLLNIPHTFLSIDFSKHNRFFHQKDAIKYLDIRKSLHLLSANSSNSVLKVDAFPYLADDYYLNINDYDFDKHSIVIGSSGTGKSKFISSLISKISNVSDYKQKYKVVIIDPHAALKDDIGGLDNTSILDFKTLENSIDLLSKSAEDNVTSTELLMSLFTSLMGDLFNSKLERVLRHSVHLLLIQDLLNFNNLRKLILDMNYRNAFLKDTKYNIPSSITDFFFSDFNELKTRSYPEAIAPIIAFIDEMQLLPAFNFEGKQDTLKNTISQNFLTVFSLDQTKIGEKITKTISGLVMQQLLQLVQSRSFDEHIIFLIDEVAVVENNIIKRFLAEARKYNLSLILAGQYFNQISDGLQKAIFANVINYYIFRISRQDALVLENNIQMEVGVRNSYMIRMKLLTELNNRECIVRVSKNGIILPAFKSKTVDFTPMPLKIMNQILRTNLIKKEIENKNFNFTKKEFNLGETISLSNLMASQSSGRKRVVKNG